ncbi:hypothetical protein LSAT2_005230 [Lamellibrachia satsuma]|nr:hypothetical protein LSAT2_005230 [Lamellibrachia satsuma]
MTSSHLPRDFKRTVLYMNILLLLSWLFNPAFAFLVHGLAWRRPHSTVDSDRDSDVKPSSGGDTRPWSIATTEKKGTRSLATPKPTRFVLRRSRTTLHERTKRWWDLGLFRTEKKYQDYRKDDTTDNSKPNRTLISIKVLLNRPNRTLSENAPHSGNISESDREFMHRANILVDMMEDRLLNRIAKKVSKTLDRDLNKAFGQLELQSLHEHDPQQPPRHEHDPQQPSRHEHDPQQPSRHEHDPQQLSRHEHHPQQPSNRLPTSDVSSVAAVSTAQRIPCAHTHESDLQPTTQFNEGKHESQAEGKSWKETTDIPSPFKKPPQKLLPETRENGKGKGKGNGGRINGPAESKDQKHSSGGRNGNGCPRQSARTHCPSQSQITQ